MKEQLISAETSRIARSKGFICNSKKMYFVDYGLKTVKLKKRPSKSYASIWLNKNRILLEAPTQSLLQRWLREKHNIHFKIDPIQVSDPDGYIVGHEISFLGSHIKNHDGAFPKYEEALEKALKEALKLI